MRFLFGFALSLCVALGAAAAVNWLVDPHAVFGNNRLGLYDFGIRAERRYKVQQLRRYPHDAVIFGSSKTAIVDPALLRGHAFFNASYHAALPEELRYFVERYVVDQKLVVVALDLYMFSTSHFGYVSDPANRYALDAWTALFSLSALRASVSALAQRALGIDPVTRPNGQHNPTLLERRTLAQKNYEDARMLRVLRDISFDRFAYSEARVADVARLVAVLEKRKIDHLLILNPLSAPVLGLLRDMGLEPELDRLRADLARITTRFADLSEGQLSRRENFFKNDPYHFRPGVLEAALNVILAVGANRTPAAGGARSAR